MNPTKRNLILAAGIIDLVMMIEGIAGIVLACTQMQWVADFMASQGLIWGTSDAISLYGSLIGGSVVSLICSILGGSFLLASIRKKGTLFAQSRWMYITGFIFTVIQGFFGIPAILLYISTSYNNFSISRFTENQNGTKTFSDGNVVYTETEESQPKTDIKVGNGDISAKIQELRKLREAGLITEEEFQNTLMKLL